MAAVRLQMAAVRLQMAAVGLQMETVYYGNEIAVDPGILLRR
jgi:hypothetical protein